MNAIIRSNYLNKIEHYLGKNTIIILTGQRRVGKSYILRLFKEKIEHDIANNVIYINKEKHIFNDIHSYSELNTYVDSHLDKHKLNFILIDEIQNIESFEKSLRSYYEEDNIEIVITGSNSQMLSSDLSTLIGGRYKEIYIQALGYEEFLTFHNLADSDDSLSKYIQFGGLPGLVRYGLEEQDVRDYQTDVYNTVLLKDVIMRHQIRNVSFIENLIRFLADNQGKIISANNISRYNKSLGTNVTPTAIINYVKFLCDSYIVHKVPRYDIHGKKLFESNDKFYFEDNGLRNMLAGGTRENDIEKVIENVVYNHLVRLGYNVMVGQLQAGEIDFVCTKPTGNRIYVQVSYIISDKSTHEREFASLHSIKDNYPKYVISMTPLVSRTDDNGVVHLHLRKFLLEGIGK